MYYGDYRTESYSDFWNRQGAGAKRTAPAQAEGSERFCLKDTGAETEDEFEKIDEVLERDRERRKLERKQEEKIQEERRIARQKQLKRQLKKQQEKKYLQREAFEKAVAQTQIEHRERLAEYTQRKALDQEASPGMLARKNISPKKAASAYDTGFLYR